MGRKKKTDEKKESKLNFDTALYQNSTGRILRLPNEENVIEIVNPMETRSGEYWSKFDNLIHIID